MNRIGNSVPHTPAGPAQPELARSIRQSGSRRIPVAHRRAGEKGATLIEYAFVIGFISLVVGFVLPDLLDATGSVFDRLTLTVSAATTE